MVAWRGVPDLTFTVVVARTVRGIERRARLRMTAPGVGSGSTGLGRPSDAPRRGAVSSTQFEGGEILLLPGWGPIVILSAFVYVLRFVHVL